MTALISAELTNQDDWDRFLPHDVEQTVTRNGRCLFPQPTYSISNLDPTKEYTMSLRFDQIGDYKLRFNENKKKWMETATKVIQEEKSVIFHKCGPQFGLFWSSKFSFNARITHCLESASTTTAYVKSLTKYTPVLVVSEVSRDENGVHRVVGVVHTFQFSCTSFVAVTKYSSKLMADIKVEMNKYAGRDSKKRKMTDVDDNRQNFPKRVCQVAAPSSMCDSSSKGISPVVSTPETSPSPSNIVPFSNHLQTQTPTEFVISNNTEIYNFGQLNTGLVVPTPSHYTGNNFVQYPVPSHIYIPAGPYYPTYHPTNMLFDYMSYYH